MEDIDSLKTPAWTSLIAKLRRPFRSAHGCSNRGHGASSLVSSRRVQLPTNPFPRRRRRGRAQVAPRQSSERRRLGSAGGRGAHVAGVVLTGTAKPRLGEPDPREALASVVDASRDSYAALSRMLDCPAGYLRRFVINACQARASPARGLLRIDGATARHPGFMDGPRMNGVTRDQLRRNIWVGCPC